jgi:hypothetical protein
MKSKAMDRAAYRAYLRSMVDLVRTAQPDPENPAFVLISIGEMDAIRDGFWPLIRKGPRK